MKILNIFGDIIGGEDERWTTSEVSPKTVIDALAEANGEPVEININSYGGSVLGGIAIANAIKKYPGETTCNVLGIAASMASAIACAGKTLKMGQGAFLMIHNPWTYTSGTAEDLRKDAEKLDEMRDSIIGIYKSKCTKSEDELKELMDAETWISRESAADFGFAVEDYVGEMKAAASLTRRAYDKAPDAVKALVKFMDKKPEDKPVAEATEKPAEAAAEETATETAPEAEKPTETQEAAPEATPEEKPAEEPKDEKPADNWEARFKGLSAKFNAAKAEHEKALAARDAEINQLKTQAQEQAQALADAQAKVSELAAQVEEKAKALQTANEDLAKTRDSLKVAEDKAKQLEDTRDMLTGGVLVPPAGGSYADKMKAAKTPEEREKLRKAKLAGKIN